MTTLNIILTFAAVTTLLLSLATFFSGVFGGRKREDDSEDDFVYVPPEKEAKSRVDEAFYLLLEAAGSQLDRQTASLIVACGALVGCAVPLILFENLPGAMAGTILGAGLPILWWKFRAWRRGRALRKVLPEALEYMADSIRAGLPLERAARMVAQETTGPLKLEFQWCASQLELGYPPVSVMQRMARRIPIPEFRIFATAVLVHRKTGGDLALLAQRLARSARDRAEFQGHVAAVTAGSRLSVVGLTVGTLVALGVLGWTRPEYLERFLSHPIGPTLLIVAACLQVLGIVWVWRILQVKY
ncbi:hypothetical protein JCM19992_10620 [Thermostilla marina]